MPDEPNWPACIVAAILVVAAIVLLCGGRSHARDLDGRYAQSPLKPWFDSLTNRNGYPCCSDADGSALSDVDWESHDGRYRVRINGVWIDVPDHAVVKGPNRAGRTMVWPVTYVPPGAPARIEIRCFMPGPMT